MMENKIKEILQPGETVKWSGRPQNVKLMEAPYGVSFILRVVWHFGSMAPAPA